MHNGVRDSRQPAVVRRPGEDRVAGAVQPRVDQGQDGQAIPDRASPREIGGRAIPVTGKELGFEALKRLRPRVLAAL
jgi:hypothetical protein